MNDLQARVFARVALFDAKGKPLGGGSFGVGDTVYRQQGGALVPFVVESLNPRTLATPPPPAKPEA